MLSVWIVQDILIPYFFLQAVAGASYDSYQILWESLHSRSRPSSRPWPPSTPSSSTVSSSQAWNMQNSSSSPNYEFADLVVLGMAAGGWEFNAASSSLLVPKDLLSRLSIAVRALCAENVTPVRKCGHIGWSSTPCLCGGECAQPRIGSWGILNLEALRVIQDLCPS